MKLRFSRMLLMLILSLTALLTVSITHPAASVHAAAGGYRLEPGEYLVGGQALAVAEGRSDYWLTMQQDGNLVLYQMYDWNTKAMTVRWHSHTWGHPGALALMQGDGNFVVYSAPMLSPCVCPFVLGSWRVALWQSGTSGRNGAHLELQFDGQLAVWQSSNYIWSVPGAFTGIVDWGQITPYEISRVEYQVACGVLPYIATDHYWVTGWWVAYYPSGRTTGTQWGTDGQWHQKPSPDYRSEKWIGMECQSA